jgi:two-component system, chemotaxis family, protein-glutamate methylesterase/glutaminase
MHTQLPFPDTAFDLVVLAASWGGLRALTHILSALPANFPAAIALVQHVSPWHPSLMAQILKRGTSLQVKEARAGDQLQPGNVYTAPSNKHLLVEAGGILSLSSAPKENFVRPAANKLFKTAATHLKERLIAVVLTGRDGDGATGVVAVKQMGGMVITQDEHSSEAFSMPSSAIQTGAVDFILPLDAIAPMLILLVKNRNAVSFSDI